MRSRYKPSQQGSCCSNCHQSKYDHNGEAAKTLSSKDHSYYHKVVFGDRSMHGQEGAEREYSNLTHNHAKSRTTRTDSGSKIMRRRKALGRR